MQSCTCGIITITLWVYMSHYIMQMMCHKSFLGNHMCFETAFFNLQKWNYWLDISNILEIGMFVTALIAVIVDSERPKLSFTVLAILLAFLTLLSYQQR